MPVAVPSPLTTRLAEPTYVIPFTTTGVGAAGDTLYQFVMLILKCCLMAGLTWLQEVNKKTTVKTMDIIFADRYNFLMKNFLRVNKKDATNSYSYIQLLLFA
jgi:hypothetical protein